MKQSVQVDGPLLHKNVTYQEVMLDHQPEFNHSPVLTVPARV